MLTQVTGDRQAPLLPLQIGHTGAKLNLEAVQKHQRSTKRAREAEHPPLRGGAARSSLKRTISADSSARFSQALSQTQELIQLKSRPRATTGADLHLARSDTVPSHAGGRECTAKGEAGRQTDPLVRQEPTFREQGLGSASTAEELPNKGCLCEIAA